MQDETSTTLPGLGRVYGWEIAVVLAATVLAVLGAVLLIPRPGETSVARAVVRAPADLGSPNMIGLYIDNFDLGMRSDDTVAVVTARVPELTELAYQEGLSVVRQGTSVLFDVSLEHDDAAVAQPALEVALDETIDRLGRGPLESPTRSLERARAELEAAKQAAVEFTEQTGVFDPASTYQGTLSDIRGLERQIREATLLRFGSAYIAGLEAAKAAAEAELPTLVDYARQYSEIQSRIEEARSDVFASEDTLSDAQAEFELNRSPEALIQTEVYTTTEANLLPWLQRVVIAAGVAFLVALLAVALFNRTLRRRRPDSDVAPPEGAPSDIHHQAPVGHTPPDPEPTAQEEPDLVSSSSLRLRRRD